MSKWLFVSYFYTKGTEQGWGCTTIETDTIDNPDSIVEIADTIQKIKRFESVVILQFRRLESPE